MGITPHYTVIKKGLLMGSPLFEKAKMVLFFLVSFRLQTFFVLMFADLLLSLFYDTSHVEPLPN
jgi:hypothetical protein